MVDRDVDAKVVTELERLQLDRRRLLAGVGAMTLLGPVAMGASAQSASHAMTAGTAAGDHAAHAGHSGPVREVAMLMYPEFFAQDLVGPYTVLASLPNTRVHLIARTMDPIIATPAAFPILPSGTFADCPRDLDVFLVPGGAFSTVNAMKDQETMEFIRDRGQRARFLTSVCTGSVMLGAAGLLDGYKATSHWVTHDLLSRFGAKPTQGRVVVDRNRITGGGVTAGIDFGLKVASILDDEFTAQLVQLAIEYDPEPPFDSGSPARAPANVRAAAEKNYASFRAAMVEVVDQLAQRRKS